jgi:hypothetical protein
MNFDWYKTNKDRPLRKEREMAKDRMLQFFDYAHLRDDLKNVSQPFGELAQHIVDNLPENPERTVALRKLLEAKDCAVRAFIYKPEF